MSRVASHALHHIDETNNKHTYIIDNLSILREVVRTPCQLDAYESIFIQKGRKNQQILLNEGKGNIRSSLFTWLPDVKECHLKKIFRTFGT
jgi:hypothetical protein